MVHGPAIDKLTLFINAAEIIQLYIVLREARTQLIQGVSLDKHCFTKKHQCKYIRLCDVCARTKSTSLFL